MRKYMSKPTQIEAIQWTGENLEELWDTIGADNFYGPVPDEVDEDGTKWSATPARLYVAANDAWLDLEEGEWIAKDEKGYYPIKDDVFRKKYVEVPE